jgi:glycosyltransferase involved in cell wall biosynthesis
MPRRLRILFYNHTRKVSGGERVLLTMLQVLDPQRYELMVACPLEGDGSLDQLLREAGLDPMAAPPLQAQFTSNPLKLAKYLLSFAATIVSFRTEIRRAAPDLLHANSVRAGIVATLATVFTPAIVLWHVQDDLPAHPLSMAIRTLAWCSRRTHVVAVSKATAAAFAGPLPFGARLHLLYNAIDRSRYPLKSRPLDAAACRFRQELELSSGDFLVVAVGMLHRRKGLLELIDSFAHVAANHAEARLAIVGAALFNQDHLYEQRLKAHAESLGLERQVHFTGARRDVPAVLRAADLLVLNASSEPFGLVVLEAMASGTPVLATRVGGIPEIIEDGVSGELVPPPSSTSSYPSDFLRDRLEAALSEPQHLQALTQHALRDVLPRFSIEAFSLQLHSLYQALCRQRSNR